MGLTRGDFTRNDTAPSCAEKQFERRGCDVVEPLFDARQADRLGHLVENVLSYSRLERGKGAEGRIPVILRDLLHRVEPRLHQRVSQAGAEFSIHHETIPDDFALTTDPAAVEQILFNLVDNACKYAARDGIPAQLELVLTPVPAALQFALRDHGPGLTRAEARKLFRPFHKSARDAAHSAPGVGLGLVLGVCGHGAVAVF